MGTNISSINCKLMRIQVFFHCYKQQSKKAYIYLCLVILLIKFLGDRRLVCPFFFFMAFDTPAFDLRVKGLGLKIDSINNTYMVLGMLFNLSGFWFLPM